jgi:hypothetical protein
VVPHLAEELLGDGDDALAGPGMRRLRHAVTSTERSDGDDDQGQSRG